MISLMLYLCWISLLLNFFFMYIYVYAINQSLGNMGLSGEFFKCMNVGQQYKFFQNLLH